MMRSSDILIGFIGVCVLGYAAYRENETRNVVKRIGMAADKVKDAKDWQLEEGFLREAVTKSADEQAKRQFALIQSKIDAEFANLARTKVRDAINAQADKLAGNVSDEIARQSMELDKDLLLKKAVEKAQNKALEKFNRKLDDVLDNLIDKFEDDRYERRRRVVML